MLTEEERKHVRLSATVDPRGSGSEIDNVNDEDNVKSMEELELGLPSELPESMGGKGWAGH